MITLICKNSVEITGVKNNLKKIENILNNKGNKIKFFDKFCGDMCQIDINNLKTFTDNIPTKKIDEINTINKFLGGNKKIDMNKIIKSNSFHDLIKYGAKDININEINYKIHEDMIIINFKTKFNCPDKFITLLAIKFDVAIKTTITDGLGKKYKTFIIEKKLN
jgi:hypothetical protein